MAQPYTAPTYGTYRWLCRGVGRYLGFSEDWNAWDHNQEQVVDEIIMSGLMGFYNPPPVEALYREYQWSFMTPAGRMQTDASERVYDLPEDLESFCGDITYEDDEMYPAIKLTSEERIRKMWYQSDITSYPQFAATRFKASDGSILQKQEILFHPVPDASYKLIFQYNVKPMMLSDSRPYPLGGTSFAEAIMASCMAKAEELKTGTQGPLFKLYLSKLASAIANDIRKLPALIGYNGDRSVSTSNLRTLRKVRDFLRSEVTYT